MDSGNVQVPILSELVGRPLSSWQRIDKGVLEVRSEGCGSDLPMSALLQHGGAATHWSVMGVERISFKRAQCERSDTVLQLNRVVALQG